MGGAEFQVVALSVDRGGRGVVEPFLARLGLSHLGTYLDPQGKALSGWSVGGLPTSVLIDRRGQAVGRIEGAAAWDSPEALRLIQRALGPSAPGPARPGPARGTTGVINTSG
jgi:hypothetical protein